MDNEINLVEEKDDEEPKEPVTFKSLVRVIAGFQ